MWRLCNSRVQRRRHPPTAFHQHSSTLPAAQHSSSPYRANWHRMPSRPLLLGVEGCCAAFAETNSLGAGKAHRLQVSTLETVPRCSPPLPQRSTSQLACGVVSGLPAATGLSLRLSEAHTRGNRQEQYKLPQLLQLFGQSLCTRQCLRGWLGACWRVPMLWQIDIGCELRECLTISTQRKVSSQKRNDPCRVGKGRTAALSRPTK